MSCGRDRQLCHQTSPSGLARPSQDTNVHYHNYSSESAENVYTECTAKHWAGQQVYDESPCSQYICQLQKYQYTATFGLSKVCAQNLNKLMQFCSNQKMSCLILFEWDHALWIFLIWSILRWLVHFNQFFMGKMYIIFFTLDPQFRKDIQEYNVFLCVFQVLALISFS